MSENGKNEILHKINQTLEKNKTTTNEISMSSIDSIIDHSRESYYNGSYAFSKKQEETKVYNSVNVSPKKLPLSMKYSSSQSNTSNKVIINQDLLNERKKLMKDTINFDFNLEINSDLSSTKSHLSDDELSFSDNNYIVSEKQNNLKTTAKESHLSDDELYLTDNDSIHSQKSPPKKNYSHAINSKNFYTPDIAYLNSLSKDPSPKIRELPPWAFLVVVNLQNPSTWYFPVRDKLGCISRSLLAEARMELSSGQKNKLRKIKFGLKKETLEIFHRLSERAMPGTPPIKLADSYLNANIFYGNKFWIDSSKDLHNKTNDILTSLESIINDHSKDKINDTLDTSDKKKKSNIKEHHNRLKQINMKRKKDTVSILSLLQKQRNIHQKSTPTSSNYSKICLNHKREDIDFNKTDHVIFSLEETASHVDNQENNDKYLEKTGNNKDSNDIIKECKQKYQNLLRKGMRKSLLIKAKQKIANETAIKDGFEGLEHQLNSKENKNKYLFGSNSKKSQYIAKVRNISENQNPSINSNLIIHDKSKDNDNDITIINEKDTLIETKINEMKELHSDLDEISETPIHQTHEVSSYISNSNHFSTDEVTQTPEIPSEKDNQIDEFSVEKNNLKKRSKTLIKFIEHENKLIRNRHLNNTLLVEEEASEEESEDGMNNYGNNQNYKSKRQNDDSEDYLDKMELKLDEDDLEGVVDDISDGEGEDGGDIGLLFHENIREKEEADLLRLENDLKHHRLLTETINSRKNSQYRVSNVLGEISDEEDTDEEQEMAREERYRCLDQKRREDIIRNGKDAGESLEDLEEEARQRKMFLCLSKLQKANMRKKKIDTAHSFAYYKENIENSQDKLFPTEINTNLTVSTSVNVRNTKQQKNNMNHFFLDADLQAELEQSLKLVRTPNQRFLYKTNSDTLKINRFPRNLLEPIEALSSYTSNSRNCSIDNFNLSLPRSQSLNKRKLSFIGINGHKVSKSRDTSLFASVNQPAEKMLTSKYIFKTISQPCKKEICLSSKRNYNPKPWSKKLNIESLDKPFELKTKGILDSIII